MKTKNQIVRFAVFATLASAFVASIGCQSHARNPKPEVSVERRIPGPPPPFKLAATEKPQDRYYLAERPIRDESGVPWRLLEVNGRIDWYRADRQDLVVYSSAIPAAPPVVTQSAAPVVPANSNVYVPHTERIVTITSLQRPPVTQTLTQHSVVDINYYQTADGKWYRQMPPGTPGGDRLVPDPRK